MHKAVILIALPTEQLIKADTGHLPDGSVIRHLRIGEVRADFMQAHESQY